MVVPVVHMLDKVHVIELVAAYVVVVDMFNGMVTVVQMMMMMAKGY